MRDDISDSVLRGLGVVTEANANVAWGQYDATPKTTNVTKGAQPMPDADPLLSLLTDTGVLLYIRTRAARMAEHLEGLIDAAMATLQTPTDVAAGVRTADRLERLTGMHAHYLRLLRATLLGLDDAAEDAWNEEEG